jgi:hypothetical protein
MTKSLTVHKALKIGDYMVMEEVLCKAIKVEPLDPSTRFRDIEELFKLVFPDMDLMVAEEGEDDGDGGYDFDCSTNIYYAVFTNDEQLVEFKMRFL